MAVTLSNALLAQLAEYGIDPVSFANQFESWKHGWPKHEFEHKLFGKDGAYCSPEVNGERYGLRHVHIVPLADTVARKRWFNVFRRKGRKVSDRHLVYVSDKSGNHGLILILDEPNAHKIAQMRDPTSRKAMEGMAVVAENFLFDGSLD